MITEVRMAELVGGRIHHRLDLVLDIIPTTESTLPRTYNARVKSWGRFIIGAGIIGLSLAISLRKQGLRVLVVERGEPGREASSAAAGMLVGSGTELPPALQALATESARMYPEFVHQLEDESGEKRLSICN